MDIVLCIFASYVVGAVIAYGMDKGIRYKAHHCFWNEERELLSRQAASWSWYAVVYILYYGYGGIYRDFRFRINKKDEIGQ